MFQLYGNMRTLLFLSWNALHYLIPAYRLPAVHKPSLRMFSLACSERNLWSQMVPPQNALQALMETRSLLLKLATCSSPFDIKARLKEWHASLLLPSFSSSLLWLETGALIFRPFYWIAIYFASPLTLIQAIRAFKAFINNPLLLLLASRSQP